MRKSYMAVSSMCSPPILFPMQSPFDSTSSYPRRNSACHRGRTMLTVPPPLCPITSLSLLAFRQSTGNTQDPNKGQVIWTANVDDPVGENACLELSDRDGNLRLVDYDRDRSEKTVWQTDTGGAHGASLAITYEGNLVLFTNATRLKPTLQRRVRWQSEDGIDNQAMRSQVLWQSYDVPSDTLMVLQALPNGRNLTTTTTIFTTSGSNVNKTAKYTLHVEPGGTLALRASIGYQLDNDASNGSYTQSIYESQYWGSASPVQSSSGTHHDQLTYDAALRWHPGNRSYLHLVAVPSSTVSNASQVISPNVTCDGDVLQNATTFVLKGGGKDGEAMGKWNITYAAFVRLEADGDLHAYTVNDTRYNYSNTAVWRDFSTLFLNSSGGTPLNRCLLPLSCGFYGVCDEQKQSCMSDCGAAAGGGGRTAALVLQDSSDPQSGCRFQGGDDIMREPNGSCSTLSATKYAVIQGARYFSNAFGDPHYTNISYSSCRDDHCSKDCNCTAAFWRPDSDGSCFLVFGPVATIIVNASNQDYKGYLKFLEKSGPSSTRRIALGILLGALVLVIAVMATGYYIWMIRRRKRAARMLEDRELEMELLGVSLLGSKPRRFTWDEMHQCTCGFSDPLGSGGFGNVFRGAMADGTPIAVKQLIDGWQQGNKEFIAEVSILGRTHHLHLVRLIGFCLEGAVHKLLVYEYMENGSLDAWIFTKKPGSHVITEPADELHTTTKEREHLKEMKSRAARLAWEHRFRIALGTARGLAYLHEECEDRVIHMDLKPQNILLGPNFFPKISDFGMSRRVVRGSDQDSTVVTMMRGTPGYLAPEWLTDGAVTEKCDVYSYGIVLLEIVSGKRVLDWRALRQRLGRSSSTREGVMQLVDERLMDVHGASAKALYDEQQATRMVEVAMLCVQSKPKRRPTMTRVVQMLEGTGEPIPYAPVDDYIQELGLLPSAMSKKMIGMKRADQAGDEEEGEWGHSLRRGGDEYSGISDDAYWNTSAGSTSSISKMMTMMTTTTSSSSRKRSSLGSTGRSRGESSGIKYMEISRSVEYMQDS